MIALQCLESSHDLASKLATLAAFMFWQAFGDALCDWLSLSLLLHICHNTSWFKDVPVEFSSDKGHVIYVTSHVHVRVCLMNPAIYCQIPSLIYVYVNVYSALIWKVLGHWIVRSIRSRGGAVSHGPDGSSGSVPAGLEPLELLPGSSVCSWTEQCLRLALTWLSAPPFADGTLCYLGPKHIQSIGSAQ